MHRLSVHVQGEPAGERTLAVRASDGPRLTGFWQMRALFSGQRPIFRASVAVALRAAIAWKSVAPFLVDVRTAALTKRAIEHHFSDLTHHPSPWLSAAP